MHGSSGTQINLQVIVHNTLINWTDILPIYPLNQGQRLYLHNSVVKNNILGTAHNLCLLLISKLSAQINVEQAKYFP